MGDTLYKTESVRLFIAQLQTDAKSHGTVLSYILTLKFECKRNSIESNLSSGVITVFCGALTTTLRGKSLEVFGCSLLN